MIDIRKFPLELLFWISALVVLWQMDPTDAHFSLCPLDQLGITWCPGCGLGRAISYLINGQLTASWENHPLAAFGLAVILYRISELIKYSLKKPNYG